MAKWILDWEHVPGLTKMIYCNFNFTCAKRPLLIDSLFYESRRDVYSVAELLLHSRQGRPLHEVKNPRVRRPRIPSSPLLSPVVFGCVAKY